MPAFSIVEILVAMLILSILSVGAIQLLSDTETQLIEDFADRSKSQKNEAICSASMISVKNSPISFRDRMMFQGIEQQRGTHYTSGRNGWPWVVLGCHPELLK
ncbi:MAG: prepilin-type N-terminal cleavage/methylation domain-containing protein [Alphaproteobacteria bacterium]|nr:prepilin-type N-terminal cleavage/methylation domain-containing protein [Alphaproteobacteria bacterium]